MTRLREAWKSDVGFGLALFFVALGLRAAVALPLAHEGVWDGHYYEFYGQRIAEGLGYSEDVTIGGVPVWHPVCHYPVGYSAYLALFFRLAGEGHGVAAIANALVGAALAIITWLLAREALSPGRARIAGALVALHPGLILYSALVMTEPLAAFVTLLAFWLAVRDRERPWRALAVGAIVLGLGALVRPQALLCAPFLAFVVRAPLVRRVGAAALACVLALAPVLPWTARNCRVMDGCALVSTNGGWNLAIGAFPRATGRFETLRSSDGCREVTGQVQQDRCWLEYGVDQIEAHPLHWLALIPAKLGFTFDHESFAVEYLHEARPSAWPDSRRAFARGVLTTVHRVLVCVAALGCVAFAARGRAGAAQGTLCAILAALVIVAAGTDVGFWPLVLVMCVAPWLPIPGRAPRPPALALPLVLLATTALTHAVFFGEDRYHVVVTPVLCLLAAAALRRPSTP